MAPLSAATARLSAALVSHRLELHVARMTVVEHRGRSGARRWAEQGAGIDSWAIPEVLMVELHPPRCAAGSHAHWQACAPASSISRCRTSSRRSPLGVRNAA